MPMSRKDADQLANWLASGATLQEVQSASSVGLVGNVRFTERARRAYIFLWTWSTGRFSGEAGRLQDQFQELHGIDAVIRRINRVRRLLKYPPL